MIEQASGDKHMAGNSQEMPEQDSEQGTNRLTRMTLRKRLYPYRKRIGGMVLLVGVAAIVLIAVFTEDGSGSESVYKGELEYDQNDLVKEKIITGRDVKIVDPVSADEVQGETGNGTDGRLLSASCNQPQQDDWYRVVEVFFNKHDGNGFRCSGFLYKSGLVLTAAHCVVKPGTSQYWNNIVVVAPYYDGSKTTTKSLKVTSCWTYYRFRSDPSVRYDWAACKYEEDNLSFGTFYGARDSYSSTEAYASSYFRGYPSCVTRKPHRSYDSRVVRSKETIIGWKNDWAIVYDNAGGGAGGSGGVCYTCAGSGSCKVIGAQSGGGGQSTCECNVWCSELSQPAINYINSV